MIVQNILDKNLIVLHNLIDKKIFFCVIFHIDLDINFIFFNTTLTF